MCTAREPRPSRRPAIVVISGESGPPATWGGLGRGPAAPACAPRWRPAGRRPLRAGAGLPGVPRPPVRGVRCCWGAKSDPTRFVVHVDQLHAGFPGRPPPITPEGSCGAGDRGQTAPNMAIACWSASHVRYLSPPVTLGPRMVSRQQNSADSVATSMEGPSARALRGSAQHFEPS